MSALTIERGYCSPRCNQRGINHANNEARRPEGVTRCRKWQRERTKRTEGRGTDDVDARGRLAFRSPTARRSLRRTSNTKDSLSLSFLFFLRLCLLAMFFLTVQQLPQRTATVLPEYPRAIHLAACQHENNSNLRSSRSKTIRGGFSDCVTVSFFRRISADLPRSTKERWIELACC